MKLNIYLESGIKIQLPSQMEKDIAKIIFGTSNEVEVTSPATAPTKRKYRRRMVNGHKPWTSVEHQHLLDAVRNAGDRAPSSQIVREIAKFLGRSYSSVSTRIYTEILAKQPN